MAFMSGYVQIDSPEFVNEPAMKTGTETALVEQAANGNVEAVGLLLEASADVNRSYRRSQARAKREARIEGALFEARRSGIKCHELLSADSKCHLVVTKFEVAGRWSNEGVFLELLHGTKHSPCPARGKTPHANYFSAGGPA